MTARRLGHGFWPYLLPMGAFLGSVEIANRAPETAQPALLALKVALPAGLLLYFAARGHYGELRGYPGGARAVLADVLVGLAGAVVWMAPYVLFEPAHAWATADPDAAFDPGHLGPDLVWLAVGLRAPGYALVTPFMEELFMRSWLMRYVDVLDRRADFRDVPIARFTWRSFLVVIVFFHFTHVFWEWPVMLLWAVGTQLWFYHRGHLAPIVLVHAVTNGTILAAAALGSGRIPGPDGTPIDLWFFV